MLCIEENVFAIGGTGEAGTLSPGEKDLDVILQEKESESALYALAVSNSGSGGLYGLFGLKLLNSDKYPEAFKKYSELPDQEKRKYSYGMVEPGMIERMEGCKTRLQKRTDIANDINEGEFYLMIKEKIDLPKRKAENDTKAVEQLSNTRKNK